MFDNIFRSKADQIKFQCANQYGIDCKMFGAYCCLSEIKNTIPLLHGPVGCAFFPKLLPTDAIRRRVLRIKEQPPFPCTDLDEQDFIYGGADKLRKALIDVDRYYHPDLIGIVLSCPAGIIGEDLEGVVGEVKDKVTAKIVITPSAGFTDSERSEDLEIYVQDTINRWKDSNGKRVWSHEKCGRLETIFSLFDQLLEPPTKILDRTINFDLFGRIHFSDDFSVEADEVKSMLKKIGIQVNTFFPGCSVSEFQSMPQASLNVMRRSIKSAELMKERYGTEYLFDHYGAKYTGLEGAKAFYFDVANHFGLQKKAIEVVEGKEKELASAIEPIRAQLKNKKVALSTSLIMMPTTPQFIRALELFDLRVEAIFVQTKRYLRGGLPDEMLKEVVGELKNQFREIKSEPEFCVDFDVDTRIEKAKEKEIDLFLPCMTSDMADQLIFETHGISTLCYGWTGYASYKISFDQIRLLGKAILFKMDKPITKKTLFYLGYDRDRNRFPTLEADLPKVDLHEETMDVLWREK